MDHNIENDGGKIETAEEASMPSTTLIKNNNFTIGPRLGIAWQPFEGKYGIVVRGAYGRYIYPVPMVSLLSNVSRTSPFTASYTQNPTSASQSPDGLSNYRLRSPQTVIMGKNSSNVVDSSTANSLLPGINVYAVDPDYQALSKVLILYSYADGGR